MGPLTTAPVFFEFSCQNKGGGLRPSPSVQPQARNTRPLSPLPQKGEDKLEEVLREFKSLRDRVILQDRRIAKLEEQIAKVAM